MSLESIYADDLKANYARKVRDIGPPPETSFSLFSALGAGLSGVPQGLLETTASVMEGLSVSERETRRRQRPAALQDQPEARGMDVRGDIFRAKAAEFGVDPKTAHAADQVMNGIGRIGGKAALLLSGFGTPVGAALLAAEETYTTDQALQAQGIDPETALLAALPQGLLTGVGVALPVSGAALPLSFGGKVAATAGLVGVGGPGSYILQETVAKEVLSRAGYEEEAKKRDPYDPLALTLSTVLPGAFGALALRGARRPIKTEADVKREVQLTPAEQAASDAFERSAGNLQELRAAIAAEKRPEAKAILEAELKAQEQAAAKAGADAALTKAAQIEEVQDAARAVIVDRAMKDLPDHPNARAEVFQALDDLAEGNVPNIPERITASQRDANFKAWFGDSKVVDADGKPLVVYHGTTNEFDAFDNAKTGSNDAGLWGRGHYFAASFESANSYALRQGDGARVMPAYVSIKNPLVVRTGSDLVTRLPDGTNVRDLLGPNLDGAKVKQIALAGGHDGVVQLRPNGMIGDLVAFEPEQIKSATGNSGRFDPNSGSLTDPIPVARAEAPNAIPRETQDNAALGGQASEPTMPAQQGKPRDLKSEVIALRKNRAILSKLQECLA